MGYLYLPTKIPYPITQVFGVNPDAYAGFGLAGHNGIDYGTPVGTPLYACRDGVIERVRTDTTGYGRHIKIEHDNCWTIYGHMSRVDVVAGQTVKSKEMVGLSGGARSDPYAGYSTGPHLHFEVRPKPAISNAYGGAVDPLSLIVQWEADMAKVLWRGRVNTAGLNVRSGPGTNYPRIDGVKFGDILDIIDESNTWLRLNRLTESWVYAPYVTKIEDVTHTPDPGPCPDTSEQKAKLLSIADELRAIADTL